MLGTHNSELCIPGILQAARVTRTREILKSGKKSKEEIFLITNLDSSQADAQKLLALKRSYWAIENKLHYRKDFVFGEDRSTIRARHGPQNMATLRNFALGFFAANNITNVKRCVDNRQHDTYALLRKAA